MNSYISKKKILKKKNPYTLKEPLPPGSILLLDENFNLARPHNELALLVQNIRNDEIILLLDGVNLVVDGSEKLKSS